MYAKFCFIEFDSPVNALNAVTAENGRKLRNVNLGEFFILPSSSSLF